MPARHLRLITGLLIFLGAMLLIGRIDFGGNDEKPPSRIEQSRVDADRAMQDEAMRRTAAAMETEYVAPNPYLDALRHNDCKGSEAARQLEELRGYKDRIISAVNLVDSKEQSSLEPFGEITNIMASTEYIPCLREIPSHLYKATVAARDTHRAERGATSAQPKCAMRLMPP